MIPMPTIPTVFTTGWVANRDILASDRVFSRFGLQFCQKFV